MKKAVAVLFVIAGVFNTLYAQTLFISQTTGGNWNLGTTWDQTGCAAGCVAGVDYPGLNDFAIIAVQAGSSINIARGSSFAVKDLLVVEDVAGSIRCSGVTGTATLTIHGQLSGVLNDLSDYASPSVNVFQTTATNLNIIFTGSNLDDPSSGAVITSWGHISPIYRTTFNPGVGNTVRVDSYSTRSSSTVQTGTLRVNSGQTIRDFTGASQFTVNASSTLNVLGAINGDGTTSSRFATATINGTLTTGSAGYFNATTFSLGSTGTLNVGFNGGNQTQGWWYQTASPTTLTLDALSTVSYQSNTAQNIFAGTYGHLSLASTSAEIKTLIGSGLIIQGNLTVGANVTFSPASQVDFSGTATQSISGTGTLNFNGGLEVIKSSGTLTVTKAISSTGFAVTQGTLNLGDVVSTLSNATISNSGTITTGTSGSLSVSGTTSFSGSGSTTLNNLTVSSGSTTFNNSVAITGNLVNSGTLSFSTSATVTFSGGNNQTISGSAFTIGNMLVNKASTTLSNNGTVELLRGLTMTTGTFDADGAGSGIFTLNSDANATAYIGTMAGGSITGEVTFERYFDNSNNRWRNIGFPVSSVTHTELGQSISLQTNSLGTYTESTLGNVDQGWVMVNNGTLTSRLGHSAYMYNTGALLISVRGPLLKNTAATGGSPYDFQVTYTNDPGQPATEDGWNFVSNPFASPINWNAVSGWTKTNVNAASAVWDTQNNAYQYSNVGWDGVVAQGQAFWVQTNAAGPSLTCQEAVKAVVIDPLFYKQRNEVIASRLMITLKDNLNYDKAVIQFNDNSTVEFDGEFDSYKLQNKIFNLSTLTAQGTNLAANTIPATACTSSVKMNISNISQGNYTFLFDGIESFIGVDHITLKDHFTNETVTLTEGQSYSFNVTTDSRSFGTERFELNFSFPKDFAKLEITSEDGVLLANNNEGDVQWYFNNKPLVGEIGKTIAPKLKGTYSFSIANNGCSRQSSEFVYDGNLSKIFPNPASTSIHTKFTVDVQGVLTAAGQSGLVRVYSLLGETAKEARFSTGEDWIELDINGLKPGSYMVVVLNEVSGVMSKEKIIIVQ